MQLYAVETPPKTA